MQEVVGINGSGSKFDFRFWLAKFAFDNEQFDLARVVSSEMLLDNQENNQSVHVAHIILGNAYCQIP